MELLNIIRWLLSNMEFLILCQLIFFTGAASAKWLDDDYIQPEIKDEEVDTSFVLHNYGYQGVQLNENNLHLIDARIPVKIIVHGWLNRLKGDWVEAITDEYLYRDNYNIIQVNWDKTTVESYFMSAASTIVVGKRIGMLIVYLHKHHGFPLETFHLIGHSLGAHVAGYAGREVFILTGLKISRISALDAASPLFESQSLFTYEGLEKLLLSTALKDESLLTNEFLQKIIESPKFKKMQSLIYDGLNKTDADVVDAIHSDSCELGYTKNLGTVDFYPNGGTPVQPGCHRCPSGGSLLDLLKISKIIDCLTCSHFRSCWYFIDSINNGSLMSTKCSSWNEYQSGGCENNSKILMGDGYIYSPAATGKFFLKTNSKSPFGQDV